MVAVLLRAAGAHSQFDRPATLDCQFLGVARFDEVELGPRPCGPAGARSRSGWPCARTSKPIAEAMVWTVADSEGFEYDWTDAPDVRLRTEVPTIQERCRTGTLVPVLEQPRVPPVRLDGAGGVGGGAPDRARVPRLAQYLPTAVFEDPYLEAARVALLVDVMGWPAAHRALTEDTWIAPNLDVQRRLPPAARRRRVPVPRLGGLAGDRRHWSGSTGRVWSKDGRLLASGGPADDVPPSPDQLTHHPSIPGSGYDYPGPGRR